MFEGLWEQLAAEQSVGIELGPNSFGPNFLVNPDHKQK